METKRQFLVVLLLVIGAILLAQTVAMAGDGDGSNSDHRPGGSKIPGQQAPTPVAEPATMALLGSGIAGLLGWRKLRHKYNHQDT
jgi:hypothetical protein